MSRLRDEDLLGIITEEGKSVGVLSFSGKGGRVREVSEQTYRQLEEVFKERRRLIDYAGYRASVHRASEKAGLRSGGTHKARRFSIQEYVKEVYQDLRT